MAGFPRVSTRVLIGFVGAKVRKIQRREIELRTCRSHGKINSSCDGEYLDAYFRRQPG